MEVAVANRLHYIKYRMEDFMYRQEWPDDEAESLLRRAERKEKIRQVLQGCAFLLSWPVVANLNLGLQERIVIGFLVLLAWAAWYYFSFPRAFQRARRNARRQLDQPGQYRQGQIPQGQQFQRNYSPVQNRPAPQGQPGQYRQGQIPQGQQRQPAYHPVQQPARSEPTFAPDYFDAEWEG